MKLKNDKKNIRRRQLRQSKKISKAWGGIPFILSKNLSTIMPKPVLPSMCGQPIRATIWQPCNIYSTAKIGENVSIGMFSEIGHNVEIGDGSRIGASAFIPEGVTIGKNVFVAPHACFTNDVYPRVGGSKTAWKKTVVCDGASVGANATILPGLKLGKGCLIAAGAVVTKDVPPFEIWAGNPAKKIGLI